MNGKGYVVMQGAWLLAIIVTGRAGTSIAAETPDTAPSITLEDTYGTLPLSFEANHGQMDANVSFRSRGKGYSLFLTPTEAC